MDFTIQDIINDIINEGFWDRCEKTYNDHLINYKLTKSTFKNDKECNELLDDFMTQFFLNERKEEVNDESRQVFGSVARGYFLRVNKDKSLQLLFDQMIHGTDGGVYNILKQLMKLMFEDSFKRHIKEKIWSYIIDLELDDKIKLAQQYISAYSDYLPNSLSSSPVLVAVKLDEVILEHIKTEIKMRGSIA